MVDLIGKRFGKLIAIKPIKTDKGGFVIWLCKCDCGKEIKVRSGNLNNGNTTTCGCWRGYTSLSKAISKNSKKTGKCMEWTGAISSTGYGIFQFKNKIYSSRRAAYEVKNGKIPKGLFVCHRCGNKKCVNPKHLYAGTAKDNSNDEIEFGLIKKGEKHPNHKLTNENIRNIRELYSKPIYGYGLLAKKFNVSRCTIARIIKKKSWKHI
jgi:hypothetical protein